MKIQLTKQNEQLFRQIFNKMKYKLNVYSHSTSFPNEEDIIYVIYRNFIQNKIEEFTETEFLISLDQNWNDNTDKETILKLLNNTTNKYFISEK